jgi:hypothetical protein
MTRRIVRIIKDRIFFIRKILNKIRFYVKIKIYLLIRRKKMRSKIVFMGLGAALVLVVFAACEGPGDNTKKNAGEDTEQIQITGIPQTVGNNASYKIFVTLAKSQNAEDGYLAKGVALIEGKTSVAVDLEDPDGMPWSGTGSKYLAVVISPKTVATWEDIDMWGGTIVLSSKIQSLPKDKWGFQLSGSTYDFMQTRVKQIFNGEGTDPFQPGMIVSDPDIIYVPEE